VSFLPFRQLAVAAYRLWRSVSLLRALLVQVAAHTPETTGGGLFAVCPDVAELLAVVTLHGTILSFVRLYHDWNVTKAGQSKNFSGFCRPRHGYEKQWKVNSSCSVWRCPAVCCHLFDANNFKSQAHESVRYVFSRCVMGEGVVSPT
jgi:hypothetical protein